MRTETQKLDPITLWFERDLTALSREGKLARAHCREAELQQVVEILLAGKVPVLVGESGVGKTAIICEAVSRFSRGMLPETMGGKRVVQFSIRRRAAALRKGKQIGEELDLLTEALMSEPEIVPYFRDLHCAYWLDLESQLQSLVFRLGRPIICEGLQHETSALFEWHPELEQQFVTVQVAEPDRDAAATMLRAWRDEQNDQDGKRVDDDALETALSISHRFLVRSRLPRKAIELVAQTRAICRGSRAVGSSAVIERFCANYSVPRELVDPQVRLSLDSLKRALSDEILGQTEAVTAVAETLSVIKTGLADERRPFGVFFFVGPSGVGKTFIAQLLAERLFGDRERVIRLNMPDYQDAGSGKIIFGDEAANSRNNVRGILSQRLSGKPFGILLLDEFEKSAKEVHDRFFQLFDEGCYINGLGESISCRSLIIIATSNAGAGIYTNKALGFNDKLNRSQIRHSVDAELRRVFRPELINRFDRIIHFVPLSRSDAELLAEREVLRLQERPGLKKRGILLEPDHALLEWLAEAGCDPVHGARYLRRRIEEKIVPRIASQLGDDVADGCTILLKKVNDDVETCLRSRPVSAPAKQAVRDASRRSCVEPAAKRMIPASI
ncbi:MAG: AAA family ATPase [Bdellovibrionota bacterium]